MNKVVLFGATSAIAHETARCFAREGAELLLIARNSDKLKVVQDDLRTLGASKVMTYACDLAEIQGH
ncbi:MAG: SDR family NAD(P)-dependent oxidoreductase, partial [Bdellovibrionales bacterium]|nr:SDR family NAD(P)-dependent oxidoreductase [Bdellovibrionales bacterium]